MNSIPMKNKRAIANIPMLRAFKSQPFLFLWSGQTISLLGDSIFSIALAWSVVELTGSSTAMSLVVVAQLIPTIIFVLLGGVVADRLPRRQILLFSDVFRGTIVLLVAVGSWLHLLQFWQIVLLALLFGVADSFFTPAYRSFMPQIVEKSEFSSANALTALSRQMSQLVGPTLGALCLSLVGSSLAFGLDSLSFFISASFLFLLRTSLRMLHNRVDAKRDSVDTAQVSSSVTTKRKKNVFGSIKEGFSYVKSSPWIWVTILLASVANIGYAGPMTIVLPKMVRDVYHAGPWLLGILSTLTALGAIAGTLVVGQIKPVRHRGAIAYAAMILSSLALIAFGLPFPALARLLIACSASIVCGFSLSTFQIIWITLLQELVPAETLGRVSSLDTLGSYSLLPVGLVSMGLLADHVGASWVFIGGGATIFCIASIGLCLPDIHKLQ